VLFNPVGEWDPITRKETGCRVLLLLAGVFQKVLEFSRSFQPETKENLGSDRIIQGKRPMRCHRTLRIKVEDWLAKNKGKTKDLFTKGGYKRSRSTGSACNGERPYKLPPVSP
jgi:hypothetical protein